MLFADNVRKIISGDTTDPDANGANIFEDPNNRPVAVSSIIQHSSDVAKFHPSSQLPNEAAPNLEEFIEKVSILRGFAVTNYHSDRIRHNGDIQTLLKDVNKVYLRGHDKEQKKTTSKILGGLLSHERSGERSYIVSHLAIDNLGTNAHLKLHLLAIKQNVDNDNKRLVKLTQDPALVTVTESTVNRGFLGFNAEQLGKKISRAEIKDVLEDLTTPHCILLS
ncbi:uncharacterized protein BYT42DRAFT_606844 [Radiomyces spectabilis]|uniref:uncharacterized protein n=1 Tax=Radiomyces spectabilis TaxID=64574 RepID=UPI00221EFB6B|nr:uncharacterized protein BYT42DRAFT_606844 [Radiomyces spectabilis]KAI8373019.1 hypothetical protein BYT42DRAFT_606844 [Radiomyces spectabilis]